MGLDFIRKVKTRPWIKGWHDGKAIVTQPSLFDLQFTAETRILTVDLHAGASCYEGQSLILRSQQDKSLLATNGHTTLGAVKEPSSSIAEDIAASAGAIVAVVTRVGVLGTTAEVSLK